MRQQHQGFQAVSHSSAFTAMVLNYCDRWAELQSQFNYLIILDDYNNSHCLYSGEWTTDKNQVHTTRIGSSVVVKAVAGNARGLELDP